MKKPGFTITELLVALLISGILISITASTYSLFKRSIIADQARAELSQNARVAVDRLSRELRQTPDIVTTIPSTDDSTTITDLEFQDGHWVQGEAEYLTYRRYYVSDGKLYLDIKEYYFSYAPTVRVRVTDVGTGGISPTPHTISSGTVISENVSSIALYGINELTLKYVTADTNNQNVMIRTKIYGRNL